MLIYQRVIAICSQWFLNIINISHIFPRFFFLRFSQADAHAASLWSLGTGRAAEPLWAHRPHCCASEWSSGLCQGMEKYGNFTTKYHDLTHIYIYMTIWQFEWGLNQSFYKHTMGYHRYMPQFYVNSTAMDCNLETMRNHWIVGQLLFGKNQLVTMMERAAKFWRRLQVKHTLVPSCELRW